MPEDALPRVLVELVLRYTCAHCRYVNILRGKAVDPNSDEGKALAAEGETPEEFGTMPEVLFCQKCEGRCTPVNVISAEDEEEDDEDEED